VVNLTSGVYEVLVTELLHSLLVQLDPSIVSTSKLNSVEAADRIALHVERVVRRTIASVRDTNRVEFGIRVARRLVGELMMDAEGVISADDLPAESGEVLRAILARGIDDMPKAIAAPATPLLDTTLLTNAPGEPRLGYQLASEIPSADGIDVVMAFIRMTGIHPLIHALDEHCSGGKSLRLLTTTYTGSTEARALDELQKVGADVRVSYDISSTRLHAKAWLFHRKAGFSTAYVGSSNLTHSAQVSGLEWNVRVSGARNPTVVEKVAAVFESYWNSADFEPYDPARFAAAIDRSAGKEATFLLSPIELRPEPFQERLLEEIALSRSLGHHRNLLVSATGTGKTVIAAIDYARLRAKLPRARLLFVAHREEILDKSRATFRQCIRDYEFGELWVGGERPRQFDHVFASIQSLHAASLANLPRDHFDAVIIDEFHHAAAPTYQALLDHIQPVELLGLTATPERSDGLSILHWFENRIAAELRLWDAIDQHRLSPFIYYGIHDGLDLRQIPWARGRGYDIDGLTNVLTANDIWANHVLAQLQHRISDIGKARVLGFCVSVAHARFMARVFNASGVNARAVWGDSPDEERRTALVDLATRRITVLFSVDLFNEGIDIPEVDTLLMLRPTDSATLFLQQLGRGLRKSFGKTVCTVLDFVGQHRKEFRFDRRLRALLGGSRKQLIDQIESGFPFLPAGCHMELDRVASDIVIRNIRESVPTQWQAKVEELRQLARDGHAVSLPEFLRESGLELDDVYSNERKSWSDLRADAGLGPPAKDAAESKMRRACGRLLHIDDLVRIRAYRRFLSNTSALDAQSLEVKESRLLRMLLASISDEETTDGAIAALWGNEAVRTELLDLLGVLEARVSHLQAPIPSLADVPLQIHARYTRVEILAAFGAVGEVGTPEWREGVKWLPDAKTDLLAFTLDKSMGHFSPTTRYKDYAISPSLIHWESQSRTREDSETGQRYQFHAARGSSILLFARLNTAERASWFLGPAIYVKHESEMPMAITWRLQKPMPGDLFAAFAAAVA
jgi:superfamily II DNA or RNA helicase/HKD family nuclease